MQPSFSIPAARAPLVTITLDKQYVPVKRQNRTLAYKTAYFGTVYTGFPKQQNFTVVFDTGSGHFFLPSSTCNSESCRQHTRYDRALSSSAVDIDHDGNPVDPTVAERDQVEIAFGTGGVIGDFVYETVCLASTAATSDELSPSCTQVRLILATELSEDPFKAFKFDGVLGLGLDGLALDPEFSFFRQMTTLNPRMEPRFAVFLSKTDDVPSEIAFGGHDDRRMIGDLHWTPVAHPDRGYWQVKISGIKIGGAAIPLCAEGDCVGILDTGTSLLGVPREAVRDLHWRLARKVPDQNAEVDCSTFPGPDLVFDLEGVEITLRAEDYSRARPTLVNTNATKNSTNTNISADANSTSPLVVCRSSLLPVDQGHTLDANTFILGEPVLRRYYTAYDWGGKRVGFALASHKSI